MRNTLQPRYHYAPAANWLSDPNGLVHQAGEWHMFYQYNPHGEEWGHMSWGHATSPDLAHWQEHAPALLEDERHMIYSGSAIIDRNGTAGFGRDAMIAIYTGCEHAPAKRQVQCLAWSNDKGRNWSKYSGNPVLDRGLADFRDPNVIWHEASGQWVMTVALSEENRAVLYGSANLRDWKELSEIPTLGAPGHLWECPMLIELPVLGERDTRWIFKVDILSGARGSGALYLVGQFDGQRFMPEGGWEVADMGTDFYAAIAWHEPRDDLGRPCWIGWLANHAYQRQLPRQGWRGAMSLPRRLSLRREGARLLLVQQVEPSCAGLFGPLRKYDLSAGSAAIPVASRLQLDGGLRHWTLQLAGEAGRTLTLARSPEALAVTRKDPVTPALDSFAECAIRSTAPVELWLDTGSLEILADYGASAMTLQHRLGTETLVLQAEGPGSVELAGLA